MFPIFDLSHPPSSFDLYKSHYQTKSFLSQSIKQPSVYALLIPVGCKAVTIQQINASFLERNKFFLIDSFFHHAMLSSWVASLSRRVMALEPPSSSNVLQIDCRINILHLPSPTVYVYLKSIFIDIVHRANTKYLEN